jgi:PncC family amidohydrolase
MLLEHDELCHEIGEMLVARGEKVAVSETTAGGLISARMLSVAGASRWFESAIVPYSGPHKFEALGVDREIAREHGAVSPPWVSATAEGVARMAGVAWGVAESGIAGPQGSRRSPKPVGAVALAVTGPGGTVAEEHVFPGSRVAVMEQITQRCLELLAERIRVAKEA